MTPFEVQLQGRHWNSNHGKIGADCHQKWNQFFVFSSQSHLTETCQFLFHCTERPAMFVWGRITNTVAVFLLNPRSIYMWNFQQYSMAITVTVLENRNRCDNTRVQHGRVLYGRKHLLRFYCRRCNSLIIIPASLRPSFWCLFGRCNPRIAVGHRPVFLSSSRKILG